MTNNMIPHFIDGKLMTEGSERFGEIYNPATGQVTKKVAFANTAIVEQAITAASRAFQEWSNTPVVRRARIIFKLKELIEKNIEMLAKCVSDEHGKLLADAKASVMRGLEVVEFACGIPQLIKGWYSEQVANEVDSYSIRQPVGICLGITPFNFPAMIPLWMFPMAIACGNTFILKPSEKNPSCSIRLAELAQEAGVPDGVLNVVQGDSETVTSLLQHPKVNAISFVGSTTVAEFVQKTGIAHGKRVQAFGGAKNHGLVMPDADLDQTVDAIVGAAYGSAGERCMALSVIVVLGDEMADALIKKLIPRVQNLKIGSCQDAQAEMGPLITSAHLEKVKNYIAVGEQEGAQLVVDGRHFVLKNHEQGFFLGGSLFDRVTPQMRIYQEEIFGPVLCVMRAPNFDTALQWINDHPYGNGTTIFTKDGGAARLFASQVQVGMVGINVPIPVPVPYHAFGGWKRSIFADIHMYGTESVQFYTRLKTVTARWPAQVALSGSEFVLPTH